MSNLYLCVNIFIWIITLIFYQRKKKYFDSGSVIIFFFSIYSIASLIHFNSSFLYKELTFFPFLYLYSVIMIFLLPIIRFNINKTFFVQNPSRNLFFIIVFIFIISSIVNFVLNIDSLYVGINKILNDPTGGKEIYKDAMDNSYNVGDGVVSNIFALISNIFSDIGILFFFYYLTFKKPNKYIIFGFLLSLIASVFAPIAQSQRGPAVDRILTILIAFYALKEFIPKSIHKKIKSIGFLLLISISIPIIAITISRFGETEGRAKESVFEYIGQQNLNFNNYAFDNNGLRYGDRTFPLFKRMLGFDNVPINFWERRIKYPNLKINDEVFIGFVGDFVLDFGPYITFLIFVLFTLNAIYRTKISNNTLLFHQLILLYFIMCVSIQGGIKLYSFSDTGGNLKLLVYILVYFAFKFDYKNSLKYSVNLK